MIVKKYADKKGSKFRNADLASFFGYTERTNVILGWHIIGEDVKQGRKKPRKSTNYRRYFMNMNQNEVEKMLEENVFEKVSGNLEKLFEFEEMLMGMVINAYDEEQDYKYITDWYRVSPWFACALENVGAPVLNYDGFSYWGLVGSGVHQSQRWEVIEVYEKHYKKDTFRIIDADYIKNLIKGK